MAKKLVTIERLELFWTKVKAWVPTYLTDNSYVKDSSYVHTDSNFTATEKTKLSGIAEGANKYTLPTASSSTLGGVKTGDYITNTSGTISLTKANVTGALGYTPPTKDTTYSAATTTAAGLMSASDKSKLDSVAEGAEVNQNAFGNVVVGSTTIAADGETDSLTLVGSNVTLTPDASNDKVTIGITKDNVTTALGYTPPTKDTTYSAATTSAAGLMSASDKSKLDGITEGANKYTLPAATSSSLGGVKVGSNISVSSDGTISVSALSWANISGKPTKLSEFTNDSAFITKAVSDLTNYYKKSEVYTQTEVNTLIAGITGISIEVVTALPTTGTNGVIYLVAHSHGTNDAYDEYVWVASKSAFEKIGSTDIDLSGYWSKAELVECTEDDILALFAA